MSGQDGTSASEPQVDSGFMEDQSGSQSAAPRYLIFDVETVGDGELISKVRFPGEQLSAEEALKRYRGQLMEERGTDVLPATFVLPVAVAIAKVGADLRIQDVLTLDAPDYRPEEITRKFWGGWQYYDRPTFVTFNGRTYDIPVMELAAFRYGISLPAWFNIRARSFEQSRNRYNLEAHLDLMDQVSNFGAMRVSGGLNLLANMLGKPGKIGIDGSQVQGMYDEGKVAEINDYCRCDVLDTYFVFLRTRVLAGQLSSEEESQIISETRDWLEERRSDSVAFDSYLNAWA